MMDAMFEMPSSNDKTLVISKAYAIKKLDQSKMSADLPR
jgi:hypothetical protein